MAKRYLLIACLMASFSACTNPSPKISTATVIPPTSTLLPTSTPSTPTTLPAIVPTMTPGRFSPNGPIMVFSDGITRPSKIILYDPLQNSQFEISKPAGDTLEWHAYGLSPDGQYMAYYTGNTEGLSDLSTVPAVPLQLELNIMRTSDNVIIFQTSLLNPDYPRNFLAAADVLLKSPPADFDMLETTRNDLASALNGAFFSNLFNLSWSNQGHVLAFASGSGGLSSDVYTYDVDTGNITRVTDGPSEVNKIIWSPDDNWILNSGLYWEGEGSCGTWYLSAANGGGSSGFKIGGAAGSGPVRGCSFGGWVSDHQALAFESANGRGLYNLELLDIRKNTLDLIWPHAFNSYAFDPLGQMAFISTDGELQQDMTFFQQGTYQVDANTYKTDPIAQEMTSLAYVGWPDGKTIAGFGINHDDFCLLPSGNCSGYIDSSQKPDNHISISASQKYLILYSNLGTSLVQYDPSGNNTTKIFNGGMDDVYWSPNPDSNPENDWVVLISYNASSITTLYHPATNAETPLPAFNDYYFWGWGWRK